MGCRQGSGRIHLVCYTTPTAQVQGLARASHTGFQGPLQGLSLRRSWAPPAGGAAPSPSRRVDPEGGSGGPSGPLPKPVSGAGDRGDLGLPSTAQGAQRAARGAPRSDDVGCASEVPGPPDPADPRAPPETTRAADRGFLAGLYWDSGARGRGGWGPATPPGV